VPLKKTGGLPSADSSEEYLVFPSHPASSDWGGKEARELNGNGLKKREKIRQHYCDTASLKKKRRRVNIDLLYRLQPKAFLWGFNLRTPGLESPYR